MRLMRRFVVLALALVILLGIKRSSISDDYATVEAFRGAKIENSVFYPLIAKGLNDEQSLAVTMDDADVSWEKGELYVNDEMDVMASLDFFRNHLFASAECYEGGHIVLERNGQSFEFFLGEKGNLRTPAVFLNGRYYLPLEDICGLFGYEYRWNAKTAKVTLISTDASEAHLPAEYDLREKGRTAAVLDQGNTQTCWAYASLAALESRLLPEEEMDFLAEDMIQSKPYSYKENDGGDYAMALSYLLSWKGPVLEDKKTAKHVQEVHFYDTDDIDPIKWEVFLHGGVSTSIYANVGSASLGGSPYYNEATNAYCYQGEETPNHDVVIVGWDDEYDAFKFTNTPPGNGAFICQNSWGADFGDNGAFYVSYYDANVGYQAVSYVKVEDADNYDFVAQMDLAGWNGQIGYGKPKAWGAAVYKADSDIELSAAGFYALDKDTSYQIYAVPSYTAVKSLAKRKLVAVGRLDAAGYYTVPFSETLQVDAGSKYALVLYISTPNAKRPLAVEYQNPEIESGSIVVEDGTSYVSQNGLDWDSVEETSSGNLCLKAYGYYTNHTEE